MKIWTSDQKGDDRIIAVFDQTIYKANPGTADVIDYVAQLNAHVVPKANALTIPLSYLREMVLEEGKNYFEVHFGASGSSEHFIVSDEQQRTEIFGFIRENLPVESTLVRHSGFRAAQKPLIGMAVVAIIAALTLPAAIGIENGEEYRMEGSIRTGTLIMALANLGVTKLMLMYGTLMTVALVAVIMKFRTSTTLYRLSVRR